MPERRAHPRQKIVLPVRLIDAQDVQFAHTVDIACSGVRLGNVRSQREVGKVITLTRGVHKAKFRVAWVRQVGPQEMQAGLESLQVSENLLGVDLAECKRSSTEDIFMTLLSGKAGPKPPGGGT